jgi:hypothetical protein
MGEMVDKKKKSSNRVPRKLAHALILKPNIRLHAYA